MSEKNNEWFSHTTIQIENIKFHIVRVTGGSVKTSRRLAANITLSGVGGSYQADQDKPIQYFAFVSEGGVVYPYHVWEKLKEKLVEQTGVAPQNIHIEPEEE